MYILYMYTFNLYSVIALEHVKGPIVKWRPGRVDYHDGSNPDTLPNSYENASDLRKFYGKMGFDDKDIVAISGAHCLGN